MFDPLAIIIPLLALALSLVLLYFIVREAIISALKRARREGWTEIHMPEDAEWLTPAQRERLIADRDARQS